MATTSTSPPGTSLPGGDAPATATFALTRDYGGTGLFDVGLLAHASLNDYLPALGSAVAGSAVLLALATSRLAHRET